MLINHLRGLAQVAPSLLLLLTLSACYANAEPQLQVEIATSYDQREWGLMGRHTLAENQGMLFVYPKSQKMNFWMFNTFIDLSIAFIDGNFVVREIYLMKAYPEKMDPNRPVQTLADIDKYPSWGPEKTFFREHSTTSKGEYRYALEVNAGWFDRQGVKIGDQMIFDSNQNQIKFTRPAKN